MTGAPTDWGAHVCAPTRRAMGSLELTITIGFTFVWWDPLPIFFPRVLIYLNEPTVTFLFLMITSLFLVNLFLMGGTWRSPPSLGWGRAYPAAWWCAGLGSGKNTHTSRPPTTYQPFFIYLIAPCEHNRCCSRRSLRGCRTCSARCSHWNIRNLFFLKG